MIEVPSAALTMEEIAKRDISFISFGTNDLTQLTLGLDRNNERIQKYFDEMHPAVLKLIKYVIDVCKEHDIETSICGQAANREDMVRTLVRFGIDSISANIDSVQRIRNVVLSEEKKILLEILKNR